MLTELEIKVLKSIIHYQCFLTGKFTLKSGITSNFYLNLRNLISQPSVITDIANLIKLKLPTNEDYYICGLPYAGIPYANAVSILFNKPNILLRKERKKHGLQNMIDGLGVEKINKVVIIDDIITTGSSIIDSIPILEAAGLEIIKIITLVDRSKDGIQEIENNGTKYSVFSLFKLQDLISINSK